MSPIAVLIPVLYYEVHYLVANPLRALQVLANRSLAPAHRNLHKVNERKKQIITPCLDRWMQTMQSLCRKKKKKSLPFEQRHTGSY